LLQTSSGKWWNYSEYRAITNQRSMQNMVTVHNVLEIGGEWNVKFSNLPSY